MKRNILKILGIKDLIKENILPSVYIGNSTFYGKNEVFHPHSPIDASRSVAFRSIDTNITSLVVDNLNNQFKIWRDISSLIREELVRIFTNLVRDQKHALAYLITLESGKIYEESIKEIDDFIDICNYTIGLSRQIYGLSATNQSNQNKILEQWYPIGVVGIVSNFNFPISFWAKNAVIALLCGNTILWKPSVQTPLCAIAIHLLLQKALSHFSFLPQCISSVVIGDNRFLDFIVKSNEIKLICTSTSTEIGKNLIQKTNFRISKFLIELSGSNATVITPSANLDLALNEIFFSTNSNTGQKSNSLKRLFIHKSIYETLSSRLINMYANIKVGSPFNKDTILGPLVDKDSYELMQESLQKAKRQGGVILCGGNRIRKGVPRGGFYVKPALVKIKYNAKVIYKDSFYPILYLIEYNDFDELLEMHNCVSNISSTAIFTSDIKESELFISNVQCNFEIVNVNIGISGIQNEHSIKSVCDYDYWKNYMKRVISSINYTNEIT